MVDPVSAALIASAVTNLVAKPISDFLSTLVPVEDVTQRSALRMIAQGTLDPDIIKQLDFYKRLGSPDNKIVLLYARELRQRFLENSLNVQRAPVLKELANVLKDSIASNTAEFLGALDDAQKKMSETENELERLDKAENDAWLKEELGFNSLLIRIVEGRINAQARSS
mgnify:CR=1 FL=1